MNRRQFLRGSAGVALAPGSLIIPGRATASPGKSATGTVRPPGRRGQFTPDGPVPPWAFDVDGDGIIGDRDREYIEGARGGARGFDLVPAPGYDPRADLFSRGRVSAIDLDAFDGQAMPGPAPPRPVVMCWHYGWYHPERRDRFPTQNVTYLGGDYLSDDPLVEERFNALKGEFGIDADLLSWIDPSVGFAPTLDNYERGYFATPSVATRRFGWLYETAINLRSTVPMSLKPSTGRQELLALHFRRMAGRMVDPVTGDLYDYVLRFDGRPVVYLFASHLLGTTVVSMLDVATALEAARRAFIEIAGVPPYLIGDEAPFIAEEQLTPGRRLRVSFFDAVARYHHYDAELVAAFARHGPVHIGGDYLQRVLELERRAMDAFAGIRNRYTGEPIHVIPSSAAGFARDERPTLLASRTGYLKLLRAMRDLGQQHLAEINAARTASPVHAAAPAIVGSWNEEFEGHALLPAARNDALVPGTRGGFEWLTAIKEVYGSIPAASGAAVE